MEAVCRRIGLTDSAANTVARIYSHQRVGVISKRVETDKGFETQKSYYPIVSGILMGDPLTKVVMTLCQLACIRQAK